MSKEAPSPVGGDRFELICGVIIAVLAAFLSINELGSGKFGGDEIAARSGAQKAYSWHSSKGLKQNLAEGQYELLSSLLAAGVIAPEKASAVQDTLRRMEDDIARYNREKKEILLGSAAVGEKNWAQDIDGKMGQVHGAKQWDEESDRLDAAGDVFDTGTLFLQLSLVLGAISLIMKAPARRNAFFVGMLGLGCVGLIFSSRAFWLAFHA